ncbi:MAG: hypothetical protein ABIR26_11360 [Ramlibacter sp.]
MTIVIGVLSHLPMFMMGRFTGYQMAGMPMDGLMLTGMALIPAGLVLAAYGLMPRFGRMTRSGAEPLQFHVSDGVALNSAHWSLVSVLVVALAVDVLKPATLGSSCPACRANTESAAKPPACCLVALTGTTVGSVLWGWLADAYGRRSC